MRRFIRFFSLLLVGFFLTACDSRDKNTVIVGVMSGPESQLMAVAEEVAKKQFHLTIRVVEFTDYMQPNAALSDESIDANMFQHQPFLDQQITDHHYKFSVIGKTFVYPMGLYSSKIKNLNEVPVGAIVAIPNDPSNEGRALLLLQKAKLITLRTPNALYATPVDIASNPKKLQFKELDAAQLTRALPDVTLAAINTNYAILAGLSPIKDAIFHEGAESPYANIIVIRTDEMKNRQMQQLVAAIQSAEVLHAARQIFKGQAIAAWPQH